MIRHTIVFFFSCIICIIPCISQTKSLPNNPEIFRSVQNVVQNYLEGKSDNQILMIIADNIYSEATPDKAKLKKTYEGCKFFFFKLAVSSDANTAVLTLKTTNISNDVRFHTFALMKDKKGNWNITSWHSSH